MKPHYTSFKAFALAVPVPLNLVYLALTALTSHAQPSSTPLDRFWRPDGPVLAILVTNDTVYLGGQFNYVGPDTGGASVVDATTAELRPGFPAVNGPVYSAASVGQGGWYVGGAFSSVGGIVRSNLARVRADNSVDPRWNPQVNESNVVFPAARCTSAARSPGSAPPRATASPRWTR